MVKTGKTTVLDGKERRKLLDAIPTQTVRDLRDRALIATLTYRARYSKPIGLDGLAAVSGGQQVNRNHVTLVTLTRVLSRINPGPETWR